MIVNGIDMTQKYGTKIIWLNEEIRSRKIITHMNWLDEAYDPVQCKENSYREFDIYIELLIRGNASEFELVRSSLLKDFDSGKIQLDKMDFLYDFCIQSENPTRLNATKSRYEITLTGYSKLGVQQSLDFTGKEQTFTAPGTDKTPAVLVLSSNIGLNSLTIEGLTEQAFTITEVQKDSKIVIDGENCTITENSENILGKTDLWEFPQVIPGTQTLKLSSECTANLSYYPRYR